MRIFFGRLFGRNLLGGFFLGGILWEEFFGRNMEGIDLELCQDFVSMPGRKGGRKDKNLDP